MPLATTLTSNSSGRGSVSSTCSILNGPKFSRATAAVIRMNDPLGERARAVRRASFCERLLQLAILVLRRIDDHLLVPGHVLVEPGGLDVLELHHDGARLCPLAQLVEPDLADNGVEGIGVDIAGELVVVEALGCLDGLLEHLHGRVCKRRLIESERID